MAMRTIQTGQNSSAAENRLLRREQVRRACLFMDLAVFWVRLMRLKRREFLAGLSSFECPRLLAPMRYLFWKEGAKSTSGGNGLV